MIAVPEPDLTARELIERAVALRPVLLERQAQTEELTRYPEETHQDFLRAGFYRTLQPRRYGGYEFGLPTFYRVVTEIARGCPSTGWALSLTAAHVLQVAGFFEKRAQDEIFGTDGDFPAASNSVRIDNGRIPTHFTRETSLLDLPVEGGTPGSKLHGNPMYAHRAPSFDHGELAAIIIGTAYAAADEYARILTARPQLLDPTRTRADLHDYQRHLSEALGAIHTAEAALQHNAETWMEACRRNVSGEEPFSTAVDNRLALVFQRAGRMAYDVLQGTLFRTAGSRHARDGERMQRYFRDAATYWTHFGASMAEPLARRVGRDRLGLPSDDIPLIP